MLQHPNTTIEGKAGDRVILPCSTKDKKDISHEDVEWLYKDPTTGRDKRVHAYFQGEDYLQRQSDDFRDRTSLFKDQLSSGNCSLSLLPNTAHSGAYQSYVAGLLSSTVRLKVLPEERNNRSHDPLKPNKLQCPNTTIEGKAGDRVILPCSTKDKKDISHEDVEWLYKDPTTGRDKRVHAYFQREDYLQRQSDDFRDRTSLFKDQLSSGNCSLSLLPNTSHSGAYYSRVGGRLSSTVTLNVLPAGADNPCPTPYFPNNGLTTTQKVVLGVCIPPTLLLLVIIIILVHRYRKRLMKFFSTIWSRMKTVYHGVLVQAHQPPQDEESESEDENLHEERIQMIENEDQGDPADGN
ncbi:uncharacterized protein AB9X84_015275 isoform 2-T4 [Acanthopagrus schlegelii]